VGAWFFSSADSYSAELISDRIKEKNLLVRSLVILQNELILMHVPI